MNTTTTPSLDDLLREGNDMLEWEALAVLEEEQARRATLQASWEALCDAAEAKLGALAIGLCRECPQDFGGFEYHLVFRPFGFATIETQWEWGYAPGNSAERVWVPVVGNRQPHGHYYRVGTIFAVQHDDEEDRYFPWPRLSETTESLAKAVALCHRAEQAYLECLAECQRRQDARRLPNAAPIKPAAVPTPAEKLLTALAEWIRSEMRLTKSEED